ncbi:MAG: toxin-antitoxin system YwqK family antitoxin [Cytophagales bacterium]|nr:toxin-antitoxin system YwqK family antitoxin [Cytophagales bacterium]
MKRLFLLPFLFAACQQTGLNDTSAGSLAGLPAGAKKEPYPGNPALVKVTLEKSAGIPLEQGTYLNGKRQGTWTTYHNNELVKSITTYVNGVEEGAHIEIDDRGQLTLKAFYHDGALDGDYIAYNRTRVVERKFYNNGKLEGTVKKYYENGNIMEESLYKNGKLNGLSKWYDQQGNVTLQYEYKDGNLIKN